MDKFVKAEDNEYEINRWEMPLGARKFQVVCAQMLYGIRVRGGFVGDEYYEYDWCCGDDIRVIIATQRILMNLIERGVPLKEIPPMSRVKPWYNDPEFINRVDYLYGENVMSQIASTKF